MAKGEASFEQQHIAREVGREGGSRGRTGLQLTLPGSLSSGTIGLRQGGGFDEGGADFVHLLQRFCDHLDLGCASAGVFPTQLVAAENSFCT